MSDEILPKQIKTFNSADVLTGEENIPFQYENGAGGKTTPAQISEYTYDEKKDSIANYTDEQKRGGILADAAQSAAVSQVVGKCESAASDAVKRFDLANYSNADGVLPAAFSIEWTNGNTYGETTAGTPTHPTAEVYGSDETLIAVVDLCDALGHFSGKGCAGAGDVIDYRITQAAEETDNAKARSCNTDIRERGDNYIIKSDGYIEIIGYPQTETKTGRKWIDGKPTYVRAFSFTRIAIDESYKNIVPNDFNCSKVVRGFTTDDTNRDAFGPKIRATNTYIQACVDYHSMFINHMFIEYTKTTD